MKRFISLSLIQLFLFFYLSEKAKNQIVFNNKYETHQVKRMKNISLKINSKTFTVSVLDNATAKAFTDQLPLTLHMKELNNNEKFAQLPKNLPTEATIPANIQTGDLMLYGSNTLVLFYENFRTTYSYSKIGHITDISGLKTALGYGDVKVIFELGK